LTLQAGARLLAAAVPTTRGGEVLTVVIEGDGRAHDRAGRPTADPTPVRPVGLGIARAWPHGPAAWLGRLCQYVRARDRSCRPEDWTSDRFSESALAAADTAVEALKRRTGAHRVVLVGWSGGGVIAAGLAARRSDVAGLVTFAAPLDVQAWTRAQGLSPLALAPEIADLGRRPLPVDQAHFLGAADRVVPPSTAEGVARAMAGQGGRVEVVDETHDCCWAMRAAEAIRTLR
jgi:dienelactone hydrolase